MRTVRSPLSYIVAFSSLQIYFRLVQSMGVLEYWLHEKSPATVTERNLLREIQRRDGRIEYYYVLRMPKDAIACPNLQTVTCSSGYQRTTLGDFGRYSAWIGR